MINKCPYCTKTLKVLRNPSPSSSGFSLGNSLRSQDFPREFSRVSGNLLGTGDGFPNISWVLVKHRSVKEVLKIHRNQSITKTEAHILSISQIHQQQKRFESIWTKKNNQVFWNIHPSLSMKVWSLGGVPCWASVRVLPPLHLCSLSFLLDPKRTARACRIFGVMFSLKQIFWNIHPSLERSGVERVLVCLTLICTCLVLLQTPKSYGKEGDICWYI